MRANKVNADEVVAMTTMVPQVHVGCGVYTSGVTVFPVWTAARGTTGVDTGVTARVSVAERAGAPVVGELIVTNEGARPVLLLEGELLEGGWQHRTLVHDLLLAPGSSRVVEVACVEHGRWSGSSVHGHRARRASPRVRSVLCQGEDSRQGAVWARVAGYEAVLAPSPTGSLLDHLDEFADGPAHAGVKPLPGQRGVILGVGGQPLLMEIFGSTQALATHLPPLLAALCLDAALVAAADIEHVPSRRARRMARHLTGLPLRHGVGHAGDGTPLLAHTSHAALSGVAMPTGALAHLSVLNTHHPLLEMS